MTKSFAQWTRRRKKTPGDEADGSGEAVLSAFDDDDESREGDEGLDRERYRGMAVGRKRGGEPQGGDNGFFELGAHFGRGMTPRLDSS